MSRAIVLLLCLAVIWLLWSGYFEPLILSFGAASVLFVLWICFRMRIVDEEGSPYHIAMQTRWFLYIPWLLKEIVVANLDVTKRILSKDLPISPVLFEAPCSQKTDLGRVIYANSITLTPGTVSYGVSDDKILVHAIAKEARDGVLTGEMDRRVTRLEGDA